MLSRADQLVIWIACPWCKNQVQAVYQENSSGVIQLQVLDHSCDRVQSSILVSLGEFSRVLGYSLRGLRKLLARKNIFVYQRPGNNKKFFLDLRGIRQALISALKSDRKFSDIIDRLIEKKYNKGEKKTARAFRRWTASEVQQIKRFDTPEAAAEKLPGRTVEAVRQKMRRL